MVKIWFNDIVWSDSEGRYIAMNEPNIIYSNNRLIHNYSPPTITTDNWGGKSFPVQTNLWESYQIMLAQRELSIHQIAKLQACRNITIEDIDNNETISIDTKADGGISIEPNGRNGTVNNSFLLTLKSRRISIYPGLFVYAINRLRIVLDSLPFNFYSDHEIITFATDAEKQEFSYDDGLKYTAKTTNTNGKRMVFYLMETDAISLKNKIEFATTGNISINPDTDNFTNIGSGTCKITELPEGLFKCEIEIITTSIVKFMDQPTLISGVIPNENQIHVVFDDNTSDDYLIFE